MTLSFASIRNVLLGLCLLSTTALASPARIVRVNLKARTLADGSPLPKDLADLAKNGLLKKGDFIQESDVGGHIIARGVKITTTTKGLSETTTHSGTFLHTDISSYFDAEGVAPGAILANVSTRNYPVGGGSSYSPRVGADGTLVGKKAGDTQYYVGPVTRSVTTQLGAPGIVPNTAQVAFSGSGKWDSAGNNVGYVVPEAPVAKGASSR